MRGDKCHPGRGKRGKIPLLPNNVGKKSVNDAGPKQGHDNIQNSIHYLSFYSLHKNKFGMHYNFSISHISQ